MEFFLSVIFFFFKKTKELVDGDKLFDIQRDLYIIAKKNQNNNFILFLKKNSPLISIKLNNLIVLFSTISYQTT